MLRIPRRYGHFVFGVVQSGLTTAIATAIASLLVSELSKYYWEEARQCACHVYNHIPGAHTNQHPLTQYRAFYGKNAPISHFQIFGSVCYALLPQPS